MKISDHDSISGNFLGIDNSKPKVWLRFSCGTIVKLVWGPLADCRTFCIHM